MTLSIDNGGLQQPPVGKYVRKKRFGELGLNVA